MDHMHTRREIIRRIGSSFVSRANAIILPPSPRSDSLIYFHNLMLSGGARVFNAAHT